MKIKRMEKYIPCKQQKRYHGYVNIKQKKLKDKSCYYKKRKIFYNKIVNILGRHIITNIYQTTETQNMLTKMYEFNKRTRLFDRNREFKTPFQVSLLLHDYIRRNKEYKT